jgi:membrane-bound ClpP family serine protease
MDAGILATLLLVVGLFLLGLEFFIPSFGMILVFATVCLIVSFWSACKAWWGSSPYFFWTYTTVLVAGIPASLAGAVTLLQRTSLGNRLILPPAPSAEHLPENPLNALTGRHGLAQTLMTPGGIVLIDGERMHAESIGMLIEPQTEVIVVGARANRIVVRPLTTEDRTATAETARDVAAPETGPLNATAARTDDSGRLDFDIPEDYTGRG